MAYGKSIVESRTESSSQLCVIATGPSFSVVKLIFEKLFYCRSHPTIYMLVRAEGVWLS